MRGATTDTVGDVVEFDVTALVAGGDGFARDPSGRVVFVGGALPGERVRARITEVRRDYSRAVVDEIVEASVDRIRPVCPEVANGCGGCDLSHLDRAVQPAVKAEIVADSLRRIGRIDDPVVRQGSTVSGGGFRTTVRAAVVEGRAGFRQARSHDVVHVVSCGVAHPGLDELLARGRYGSASEVTLRIGAATGERLALVRPDASDVVVPEDVIVVGADESRGVARHYHEVIDGRWFRISAGSFFQTSAIGAGMLVDVVRSMTVDLLALPGTAIDAYCGVGLFTSCLASSPDVCTEREFVAVERNPSSAADARVNLLDLHARVVETAVEDITPADLAPGGFADLVIADPARAGLGRRGVDVLTSSRPQRLILVSCDPASLGRDAGMLVSRGYRLVESVLVDMFPDTHHVEVVSRFERLTE